MPNQPSTPLRPFRIPDELYLAAKAKAQAEGRTLSEVIRALLECYLNGG